jgi:hypothetical protein
MQVSEDWMPGCAGMTGCTLFDIQWFKTMADPLPGMRRDLEFFPIQYRGEQLVLIKDHLGLVQEGKALPLPLFQMMALFDGTRSLIDLQTLLMRQGGGVLVGSEEIKGLLARLDESFLLDSERFSKARDKVVADFSREPVRNCSHSGNGYPAEPDELRRRLDIMAVVSPHIDLAVGRNGYANAYNSLKGSSPSRIIVLGIGHRMADRLFCLTEKDFQTPLGVVRSDKAAVQRLRASAPEVISEDDFAHRSEHSIEFQILFLQHIFPENSFTIVPILCGSIHSCVPQYRRSAYLERAGAFTDLMRSILLEDSKQTLLIAGVDFSHIGPKFGHELDASTLEPQAKTHDRNLLEAMCRMDGECFWDESAKVEDRYNVCGFSALACLLETLPPCKGELLGYECWHEEQTRSAVSFASMVFRGNTGGQRSEVRGLPKKKWREEKA